MSAKPSATGHATRLHSHHPPEDRRGGRERRRAERRGRVISCEGREARLRFAAQAAGFATYDFDCRSGDSVWSPELRTMAGLAQDSEPLSMEQVVSLVHPEDRVRFRESFLAALDPAGSGELEAEHRLLRPDGSLCWVRTKGRTLFAGQGEGRSALASTGLVMDVTASHLAQQELAERREELTKLVESSIDGIITIEPDQRIVRFNPAAAALFGCSPDDVMGSSVERFIPERFRAKHREGVRRFAEGSLPPHALGQTGTFRGQRADGQEFAFEASLARALVGGHCLMTIFLRDISERVKADEALRRSKEYLELAIRGGNTGTWHWEAETGKIDWSPRTYELFGLPAGEIPSADEVLEAVHPDDRERVLEAVRQTLETGAEYEIEHRTVWPDGSVHWLQAIGRRLEKECGDEAAGIRGIVLDITERKRKEEALAGKAEELEGRVEDRTRELIQANKALERSNLDLQQFAFIAAHDLQTPLRSISGFAHLLQSEYRGRIDAKADVWLNQMIQATQRMHELIRDLLLYARLESRGSPFRPVDFNRLVDDVVAALADRIHESGAVITRDALPTVTGDRSQLAQVVQNLVDNAIKYHGSRPPRIHISVRRAEGGWAFAVRDEGIGIREQHQEQIFDVFRRLHNQQDYPGTGIGLAICRRVIHRHGGRIWVESEEGRGSTFHFTLPDRGAGWA